MKLTRTNAILQVTPTGDYAAYGDRLGTLGNSGLDLWDPDGAEPNCLIVEIEPDTATIVPLHGGLAGTVKVKLFEAVSAGHELYFVISGANSGFADANEATTSGTWFKCALALEAGVAGEMVEAVLFCPEQIVIA